MVAAGLAFPVIAAAPALASVSNSQDLPPVYSNWPKNPTNWPCYATPSYACTQGGYGNKSALASGWPNTYYGKGYASTNKYGMHNCTLYVAFRLKENGFQNPGNWGNASNWATAANADHILVNQTPAVGSIAQWNAGAGGDGHVAYVESVSQNSSGGVTAITITEDNFMPETGYGNLDGGYTAEIHITAGAAVWPANFIHAKDLPSSSSDANLVYQDPDSTTIYMLSNLASGPALSTVVTGWQQPAWEVAGDFRGNGQDQLVYQDPGSSTIYMLSNLASGPALSTVVTGWQQPAWEVAGDFR
jgi:surface antigen